MLTDKTFGQISQRWPVKYLRSIHVDKLVFDFVSDTLETGNKIVSHRRQLLVVLADIKYELFSTFTLQKWHVIHWPVVKTNPSSLWYLFDRESSVQPENIIFWTPQNGTNARL